MITVIVVAAVVAFVGGALLARHRAGADTASAPEASPAPRPPRPEPAPMTGLEEALNKATDRTGHTLADRLDGETDHVADLRHTDDTGPLLRRALDSVDRGHDDVPPTDASADDTPGTDRPHPEST